MSNIQNDNFNEYMEENKTLQTRKKRAVKGSIVDLSASCRGGQATTRFIGGYCGSTKGLSWSDGKVTCWGCGKVIIRQRIEDSTSTPPTGYPDSFISEEEEALA